jgi:HK97 family phage portal protein
MRVRSGGRYESRAFNPSGSYAWNDSLQYSGVVPPHGFSTLNKAGVSLTEQNVTQAAPVNRSIGIIANSMIWLRDPQPYTIAYDKDNYSYRAPVAPIPQLLMNTWGTKTQSQGMTEVIYSMALFGEAFCLVTERDDMGDASALEILPTMFIDANKDGNGNPTFSFVVGGSVTPLNPANVVHIKLNSRPGRIRAASSLQQNSLAYALYLASLQYGLQFFGQGVHSSFVLTTDDKLTDDIARRTMTKLIIEHSGLSNAHLPLMLDSGLRPQKFAITPDEAQFINTMQFAADDCATYFGVPASWIGPGDKVDSLGKTIEEQKTHFVNTTMVAYFTAIQEELSKLLPMDQRCAYEVDRLTRGNSMNVAKEIAALRTATVFDPNEIRRRWYDAGPHSGGDGDDLNAPLASNQTPGSDALITGGNPIDN